MVRASTESAEFDLKGLNQQQATDLINTAFGAPIDASEYLRFSFVVGGGKKIRKNYEENLPMVKSRQKDAAKVSNHYQFHVLSPPTVRDFRTLPT